MKIEIARSNSLADLAIRINAEHDQMAKAVKRGLSHAIAAGELLIEAKKKVPHGQWLSWLKENCTVPERTASHHMRLARHRSELEQIGNVADLSLHDAVEVLAPTGSPNSLSPVVRLLAELQAINPRIKLHATGMNLPILTIDEWKAVGRALQRHFGATLRPIGKSR